MSTIVSKDQQIAQLVDRNARLAVALRHTAREIHTPGRSGHHGPWFHRCDHEVCTMVSRLVNHPEDIQRAAGAADDKGVAPPRGFRS